ncbi:type III secretion system chaperone [Roseibium sp.]|uniref:type III secretion system chaperone n=1 Tax=Roseibium sp. TaxID=1936156 RepID=UPI003267042E
MITRDEANLLLSHLAKRFDIASLELNDVNTVVLAFGETNELIIEFVEQGGLFVFWCVVGSLASLCGDKKQLEFAKYLLNKNFPSKALNGAYFATDSELDVVLLARRVEFNPSQSAEFIQGARVFAEQALHVTKELDKAVLELPGHEPAEAMALQRGDEHDTTFIRG